MSRGSSTLDRLALEGARRRVRHEVAGEAGALDRRRRRAVVVATAAGLFALTFAARLTIDDPNALIANFYTLPVALLAIEFGVRGGLAGSFVAIALVFAWSLVNTVDVGVLGYTSRCAAVLLVGTVVGYLTERLRADIRARERAQWELALYTDELERANASLARSVVRLEAFADIARAVGGETDLRRVLELILEAGREILDARSLLVFLREGDELVHAAGGDGTGLRLAADASLADALGAESCVVVPLVFHGERLGVLAALDSPAVEAEDAGLLEAVGASAATAVMTAKSVARERLRDSIEAGEKARRRWARELHDETLQGLGGLGMLLSSALAAGDDAGLRRAVAQAVEQSAHEVRTLRGLIAELRPAALDDLGLGEAIESLAERTGLAVRTEIELEARLPAETESTVYRIAQEALTNVVKHAEARAVLIRVGRDDGRIEVLVRDDGRGFDPDARCQGLGLVGMRERVALAGGRLSITSCPGGPSTVEALIPLG
jgi:signal transduction histidine kinase